MDVYDISNIKEIKGGAVNKWTMRQRIKASRYRKLYKILECEMSVLGAKFPFLEGSQIKCIALNWIGIPTLMGHIPNPQTIGYLIPARDKKKVISMIQLLLSKQKASKGEEKLLNEVSQMILKSCSSFISVNSSTVSNSATTTLSEETSESTSTILTLSNEELTIPPPELLTSLEAEEEQGRIVSRKLDKCKRKISWDLGSELSERRRKTNSSGLVPYDLSEDTLQMRGDETLGSLTKTVTSGDNIPTQHTSDSVNMVKCSVEEEEKRRPIVSQKRGKRNRKPSCSTETISSKIRRRAYSSGSVHFDLSEDTLQIEDDEMLESLTKTVTSGDSIRTQHTSDSVNVIERTPEIALPPKTKNRNIFPHKELCSDSDITRQNLLSASSLIQETSIEITNEENTRPDSLMPRNKRNIKATVNITEKPSDGSHGLDNISLKNHDKATDVDENNETAGTKMENELMVTGHSDVENTEMLSAASVQVLSRNQIFQSEEVDPSQTTNNKKTNVRRKLKRRSRKEFKISTTELLEINRRSRMNSSGSSKEDSDKEDSHDACAAISPSPSSKVISQELDHQSPIQYLSLETYSSAQESEAQELPSKTEELEEIPPGLLVDLFRPLRSDAELSTRVHRCPEGSDDENIYSLETILREEASPWF